MIGSLCGLITKYTYTVTKYIGLAFWASLGSYLATLFGGWTASMKALLIFMTIDIIMGVLAAAAGRSKKSKTGKINSRHYAIGLTKKSAMLLLVIIAVQVDILLATPGSARGFMIYFLIGNEGLSILENYGRLMGNKYVPKFMQKTFEVLRNRGEENTSDSPEKGNKK